MAIPERDTVYSTNNTDRVFTRESSSTGWFVGIIVALALLAIGYLVFSANSGSNTATTTVPGSTTVDVNNTPAVTAPADNTAPAPATPAPETMQQAPATDNSAAPMTPAPAAPANDNAAAPANDNAAAPAADTTAPAAPAAQ
jgi:hypothetical protein